MVVISETRPCDLPPIRCWGGATMTFVPGIQAKKNTTQFLPDCRETEARWHWAPAVPPECRRHKRVLCPAHGSARVTPRCGPACGGNQNSFLSYELPSNNSISALRHSDTLLAPRLFGQSGSNAALDRDRHADSHQRVRRLSCLQQQNGGHLGGVRSGVEATIRDRQRAPTLPQPEGWTHPTRVDRGQSPPAADTGGDKNGCDIPAVSVGLLQYCSRDNHTDQHRLTATGFSNCAPQNGGQPEDPGVPRTTQYCRSRRQVLHPTHSLRQPAIGETWSAGQNLSSDSSAVIGL
ncbi:unknown (plasmid) [Haloarcula marismortui ATCC 43049]|uniref:Uncharacterized protein n=1 Tax=Haloarcula marismortui (strain ATCC 43049 / DSM 3752 / JCM 8966 / VKM B-1809) TaxID=272569 RepID=Q5V7G1_HALMA|nr:unknown [Haloarcula marismortui ATCC 43049]